MYSIGASPYNSGGASLYGGFCDPSAVGGAMMGGFAPGNNTADWLQLLKTQKFLSLKKRLNGLTESERARRKLVNKIIMKGTLDKNRQLKMARLIAAQPGSFNYVPPSNKVRHYWTQDGVNELELAKRIAWDQILDDGVQSGADIQKILKQYDDAREEVYNRQPTAATGEVLDWSKALPAVEYDRNGTFFSGFTPDYDSMALDQASIDAARAIRRARRAAALERSLLRQGWSRPAAKQAAQKQASEEGRMEDAAAALSGNAAPALPPPPIPGRLAQSSSHIRSESVAPGRAGKGTARGRTSEIERLRRLQNELNI